MLLCCHILSALIQDTFDLHLSLANAVGFIPVSLGQADFTNRKAHTSNAFEFMPPATTELFSQSPSLANRQVGGNNLNAR